MGHRHGCRQRLQTRWLTRHPGNRPDHQRQQAPPKTPDGGWSGYKATEHHVYLELSHYHSDHTANANDFAGSTWLVQQAERDFMFGPPHPGSIIDTSSFSALKDAKTKIIGPADYDVFGDGTVVIKSAPGHTPGHQVLFVKLARPDRSSSPATFTTTPKNAPPARPRPSNTTPNNPAPPAPPSEAFLKTSKAQLWIEHDAITFATVRRAA